MEHVVVGVLVAAVALLAARGAKLRRRVRVLERRAATAEAAAGATRELATVGEFVTGLAGQLKTPLQGVLGNTEVMLASDLHGRTEELRDIHEHAARAAEIVRSLVAFGEATSLTRRWDDLNEICRRAIGAARPHGATASRGIQAELGSRLPLVYVDGRQLEKAIATLLGQVAAGRPAGAAPGPLAVVSTCEAPDDRLIIDLAFPGATADAVGRALASGELDACRHVIGAHGGRVRVDSRSDGAAVAIEVPAAVVDLEPSSPPRDRAAASQEPASSWTTLSTSSTSTANGTSRS